MRTIIERVFWGAVILGAFWLLMAEAAAYSATPRPVTRLHSTGWAGARHALLPRHVRPLP